MTYTKGRRLEGSENLYAMAGPYCDQNGHATVQQFWQWAYSRLIADVTRGALAEFIVGRLVGADMEELGSPDREYDLRTLTGHTIEVKSSAFWQEWQGGADKPTVPSFSGLKCRLYMSGGFTPTSEYRADIFVFCLLGHTRAAPTRDELDPLDLDQWEFYVLTAAQLSAAGSPDRLSLAALRGQTQRPQGLTWNELRAALVAAADDLPVAPVSGPPAPGAGPDPSLLTPGTPSR